MKISLYGQYIKERQGRGIVETKDGFATFDYISENTVYIVDLYVVPEKRNKRIAASLADKIVEEAVKAGKKYLLGSVDTSTKSAEQSVKVLLAYGMHPHKRMDPMLFFAKQIADIPVSEDIIKEAQEELQAKQAVK